MPHHPTSVLNIFLKRIKKHMQKKEIVIGFIIYMHTYIHTYIHIYTYIPAYTLAHTCVCACARSVGLVYIWFCDVLEGEEYFLKFIYSIGKFNLIIVKSFNTLQCEYVSKG